MTNNTILTIFNNFRVDGVVIPVKFLKYKGSEETYITFSEITNNPAFNSNDKCEYSTQEYDFDIYTKGNYKNILTAVKQKLKDNGFSWIEDSSDMFEEDTSYYHKTTTFEIENYIN